MSSEFADLLKDTLSKMQDRIEFANKDQGDSQAELDRKFMFETQAWFFE